MNNTNWYSIGSAVGAAGAIVSAFLASGGVRAGFALVGAALAAFFLHQLLCIYRESRTSEAASRAAEHAALVAELSASRGQADKWITNHLEHDRVEREKHAEVLSEIAKHLSASAELLRGLESSVTEGFKASSAEHSKLRLDLARRKKRRSTK